MPTENVQVKEDYYVIALTKGNNEIYFKSDRYSPYNGSLQADWHVEQAQQFKTEKGARAAIDRLLAKGVIRPHHQPRVIHYTETITRRWETLEIVTSDVRQG